MAFAFISNKQAKTYSMLYCHL